MVKFSLLDLCPVAEGSSFSDTFAKSRELAQHAEAWGYHRYWLAEHHNMPGIASAATSVVIGNIAEATHSIRVGSGGVMLPNHSPLAIAEQFGTLAALYPNRIDLGLGRAPGTDGATSRALRRDAMLAAENFPDDVRELLALLGDAKPGQQITAVPGVGSLVPVWILGSSTFGARLAAEYGLPYAFASHFAPADLTAALRIYREYFKPSPYLQKPYVMLGFTIIAADSDAEANYLASSMMQSFVQLRRGKPGKLQAPIENFQDTLSPSEQHMLRSVFQCSAIGGIDSVKHGVQQFLDTTQADELMITGSVFEHKRRLNSFQMAADICNSLVDRQEL